MRIVHCNRRLPWQELNRVLGGLLGVVLMMAGVGAMAFPEPPALPPRPIAAPAEPVPGVTYVRSNETAWATLFLPAGWSVPADGRAEVVVHFHTAAWFTIQEHLRRGSTLPLLVFALGEGSATYARPFQQPDRFQEWLRWVESELAARGAPGHTRVTAVDISSFSAGYGAVREILKLETNFNLIRRIVLCDSIYGGLATTNASGSNPGYPRRPVLDEHVAPWRAFARAAARGEKTFLLTTSDIETARYASTRECAAAVAAAAGAELVTVPVGANAAARDPEHPLRERADLGRFHVWHYAGTNAAAHLAHVRHLAELWQTLDAAALPALHPVVEAEEDVYTYIPANNGAGPMWCHGSTSLVRVGARLFASGLETLPELKPLNNCRWVLFERGAAGGWQRVWVDPVGLTREPSPLAALADGTVLLSANPTLGRGSEPNGGRAKPEVYAFDTAGAGRMPRLWEPAWKGAPGFSEHSYRSLAADGPGGEFVLLQNIDYSHAEWTFRDRQGRWSAQGRLAWPWGAGYDQPGPVRVCYPNVGLRGRAVYFCGVSDVLEPYKAWREFKRELTGQQWDYDFRRLFFTWTPDITREPFAPWTEVASCDRTAGWVAPGDLFVGDNGEVHLVWSERALDERLRAKFFPEAKQRHTLNYAVVRAGQVVLRRTIEESAEERPGVIGAGARFQVTPERRLFVVYHGSGGGGAGNRAREVLPGGVFTPAVAVPLAKPFGQYFSATVRAGSPPSRTLDMLGLRSDAADTMRYARVRLY